MATLTLGLSAVITGLIVLWDRYSDSQEAAAAKAKERVEIEKEGRAQMIKTRFEIDSTLKSLKEFNGTKEQERRRSKSSIVNTARASATTTPFPNGTMCCFKRAKRTFRCSFAGEGTGSHQ